MTNNIPSLPNQPSKWGTDRSRRLPSFRVRCALAVGLFALGIALGAAIGPAPQSSLAGTTTPPNTLIASLLSRYAASPTATATASKAPTKAPTSPSAPTASGPAGPSPTGLPATPPAAAHAGTGAPAAAIPRTPVSEPSGTTPASSSSGTSTPVAKGDPVAPLPAIAHVWLIALPGAGFASAQSQSSADPYLSQQLVAQGTLLKTYSPLAAGALSADAALLSGQSAPQEISYTAPGCDPTAQPACTPGSASELAGVDSYLHQLIPQITASAEYSEHGLIAITFFSAPAESSPLGGPPAPVAGTLAAQPLGVLLLSPFLRKRGTQSTAPFHPATPRKDLERLLHG
jgi:hypothetical protein